MPNVVTLIAMKREVAVPQGDRFSVERMSSYDTWRQVTVPEVKCRLSCKNVLIRSVREVERS